MLEHDLIDLDKLQLFLDSLPLTESPLEHCPVTNEMGRRAPFGKAFRISGQFWVEKNFFNDYTGFKPSPSLEAFKDENRKHYSWLLDEFGGDEKRALKELVGDVEDFAGEYDDLPKEFMGKWLVVSPGRPVTVKVKENIIAWVERQNMGIIDDLTPETKKEPIIISDFGDREVIWNQYYANAILGECKIDLVDFEEEAEPLYVPEPVDQSKIEKVEYLQTPASHEYSEYYGRALGRKWSEEERLNFMRNRRRWGDPLSDDPLKDFVMPDQEVITPPRPKISHPEKPKRKWIIRPEEEKYLDQEDLKF